MTEKKKAPKGPEVGSLGAKQLLRLALDGWGQALLEAEELGRLLKVSHNQNEQLLAKLVESQERLIQLLAQQANDESERSVGGASQQNRRRGRPTKAHRVDVEYLEWFERERAAFSLANPGARASDSAVLTWSYKRQFSEWGLRPSRVDTSAFQAKLKSIRNQISDLRNPVRKLPKKD